MRWLCQPHLDSIAEDLAAGTVKAPHEAELGPHAQRVADDLCRSINRTVPASVKAMQYARQWVLEESIKLLQARV